MKFGTFKEYKGYTGSIEISFENKYCYGELLNVPDLVNYETNNVKDLYKEFCKAVDNYIEFKKELNKY